MARTAWNLFDRDVIGAELRERVELLSREFYSKTKLAFVIPTPWEHFSVIVIICLDVQNGFRISDATSVRWRRALFFPEWPGIVTAIPVFELFLYPSFFSIIDFCASSYARGPSFASFCRAGAFFTKGPAVTYVAIIHDIIVFVNTIVQVVIVFSHSLNFLLAAFISWNNL